MMIRNPPRSLPPGGSIAVLSALPSPSRNVRKSGISRCTWGLEADVALDRVGPLRTPGLDCLLPVAAEIFLDCVAHQARLMRRFAFRLDAEPGLAVRRVANILHFDFACPAIPRNSRAAGLQNQYEIRSRA